METGQRNQQLQLFNTEYKPRQKWKCTVYGLHRGGVGRNLGKDSCPAAPAEQMWKWRQPG
jgi:hypothetical protein